MKDFLMDLAADQLKKQVMPGLTKQVTDSYSKGSDDLVSKAFPLLLSMVNKKASTETGAKEVFDLVNNFDGGMLDNLSGLLGTPQEKEVEKQGSGLLDMLLGGSQKKVQTQLAEQSGLSKGQVLKILSIAAPMVISFLKNKQQKESLSVADMTNFLSSQNNMAKEKGLLDNPILKMALDKDGDGSIIDDIAEKAGKSFLKRFLG